MKTIAIVTKHGIIFDGLYEVCFAGLIYEGI